MNHFTLHIFCQVGRPRPLLKYRHLYVSARSQTDSYIHVNANLSLIITCALRPENVVGNLTLDFWPHFRREFNEDKCIGCSWRAAYGTEIQRRNTTRTIDTHSAPKFRIKIAHARKKIRTKFCEWVMLGASQAMTQ